MRKKKKYLDFYHKYMPTGELPSIGLCGSIPSKMLDLFKPTKEEEESLLFEDISGAYWGSGLSMFDHNRLRKFTPLRQTIVLLLAAMNGEL